MIVLGAWQNASAWIQVVNHLQRDGHKAIAINLPARNIAAGGKLPSLEDYKQVTLAAVRTAGALRAPQSEGAIAIQILVPALFFFPGCAAPANDEPP